MGEDSDKGQGGQEEHGLANVGAIPSLQKPTPNQLRIAHEFVSFLTDPQGGSAIARWLDSKGSEARVVQFVQAAGLILPGNFNVEGWDLSWLMATGADFTGWNFKGSTIRGLLGLNGRFAQCDFTGAELIAAVLSGANLRDAKLVGTDLTRAILRKADLRGANLRGADLTGANLVMAQLDGACFEQAILAGTIFSPGVRIGPDGFLQVQE